MASANGLIGRTLYRSMLRELRGLAKEDKVVLIEKFDVRKRGWKWFPGGRLRTLPSQAEVLASILPQQVAKLLPRSIPETSSTSEHNPIQTGFGLESSIQDHAHPESRSTNAVIELPILEEGQKDLRLEQLTGFVKQIFRHRKAESDLHVVAQHHTDAFEGLKTIGEQRVRHECTSTNYIRGLELRATAVYQQEDSKQRGSNLFGFRVTIKNESNERLRLIGRNWKILNKAGDVAAELPEEARQIKNGPPPFLQPGQSFEYYSGVDIAFTEGQLCGSFLCLGEHGETFDAEVKSFCLKASPEYVQ